MTPKQFFDEMNALYPESEIRKVPWDSGEKISPSDTQGCHQEADELMCRALEELGYGAGVRLFRIAERWYA